MSGWLGDRHWQMLAKRMHEQGEARRTLLANGAIRSFEEYREYVGYLACLREINAWSDEIIKSMDARPPSARTA